MKTLFLALVLLASASVDAQKTSYAVILVIDGARNSEAFADSTHANIPHLWNNLRPLGTWYPNFFNNGATRTNPGHSSILSGTWQVIANDGTERPHKPTLFEYFRKFRSVDSSETAVVLGKEKLDILAYSDDPDFGSAYRSSLYLVGAQYEDTAAFRNFRQVSAASHPKISIINLPATDHSAHTGVWSSYIASLRGADSLAEEFWNFIQSDSIYRDRTTLFITNDHGRHLDGVAAGWSDHGDGCAGCRHVNLLVLGPDTPAGVVDSTAREQTDIAPTVGTLLGFPTPAAIGTMLGSAFPTGVGDDRRSLPLSFAIEQNFPNPFNPATALRYTLSEASHVTMTVVNLLGQEVARIVDRDEQAGAKTVRFDARGLPSGIYFCRIDARALGGQRRSTASVKMVLAR